MIRRKLTRAFLAVWLTAHAALALAQSEAIKELRTTLELVFMCSTKNDTTRDVKRYFESTGDETLQREWNRAIVQSQKQMKDAQNAGGQSAVRAMQRYDLSCTLLNIDPGIPLGLQSALHK